MHAQTALSFQHTHLCVTPTHMETDETHADTRAQPALSHASPPVDDRKVGQGRVSARAKEKSKIKSVMIDLTLAAA